MCAVEVRGPDGTKPVKMSTKTVSVTPDKKMIWGEPLHLCAPALPGTAPSLTC
jgi:hypothetical protein